MGPVEFPASVRRKDVDKHNTDKILPYRINTEHTVFIKMRILTLRRVINIHE